MEVVYNTKFLLRRGTAESWEHNNPILAYGEPGYDVTNYGLKIGDGKTRWKDLDFLSASKEQIEEAINKYFEENPGSGTSGAPGKDGVSATHRWQGTTLIITSASGTSSANLKGEKGDPGKTPQKYVDYWTEGDKQEIISEIPVPDLDGYATEEYVNKQIANAQLGNGSGSGSGSGSVDLSSYYTKSETNEVIQDAIEKIELTPGPKGDTPQKYIDYFTEEDVSEIVERVIDNIPEADVDLEGYATEQWVSDKYQVKGNYLTEVPEEYAKSSEIPTRPEDIGAQPAGEYLTSIPDGYATQEYVKNKIAEASLSGGEVDLSGYATKEELPTKTSQLMNDSGYLTEHIDISGKLDASKLPTAINTALAQAKASGEFDGPQGDKGDKGDTGATGAAGKSAYTYATESGYNGTTTEFGNHLANIGNKLSMELLWENSSPTSAFSPPEGSNTSTIPFPSDVNITEYDMIFCELRGNNTSDQMSTAFVMKGARMMVTGYNLLHRYRLVYFCYGDSNVRISRGYYATAANPTKEETDGNTLIPTRIYGIKGVM